MMISSQITIIPNFVIMRYLGLVDTHLGVILPQLADGFSIFLMRQFFLTFPYELEDAAKLDGCDPLMFYIRILIPNSKPILATLAVMTFQGVWNDFLWPLVMLTSPGKRTLAVGLSYLVRQYCNSLGFADGRISSDGVTHSCSIFPFAKVLRSKHKNNRVKG